MPAHPAGLRCSRRFCKSDAKEVAAMSHESRESPEYMPSRSHGSQQRATQARKQTEARRTRASRTASGVCCVSQLHATLDLLRLLRLRRFVASQAERLLVPSEVAGGCTKAAEVAVAAGADIGAARTGRLLAELTSRCIRRGHDVATDHALLCLRILVRGVRGGTPPSDDGTVGSAARGGRERRK